MKKYYKIYEAISRNNSKIYNFKTEALFQVLFSKISYFFTPIFIIFKITPNTITFMNFIVSIFSIILILNGKGSFLEYGILLYLVYRIFDFCDGAVARHFKQSTFYGRFIDGLADIFLNSFLILSLAFYSFQIFESLPLLIFGCVTGILTSFDTFIYDRYSALARWSNSENRIKVLPYIKKTFMPKSTNLYSDLITILLVVMPFLKFNESIHYTNLFLFF